MLADLSEVTNVLIADCCVESVMDAAVINA